MHVRETAVAGQFYPASAGEIEAMIVHYNKLLDTHADMKALSALKTRAVIVPHAGYIYSGFTANVALRILGAQRLERVVVIGPSHRVYLEGVSVADYDRCETPLGALEVDRALVEKLERNFGLHFYPEAHAEHSTEVQMPFIKYYMPKVKVVELVYGKADPAALSKVIDTLLDDPMTGVVISTDLSHYYDIDKAKRLDSVCLDAIARLDPAELHQGCEACGKIGVEAMLLSAKAHGLKPHILDYRTSADASGDKSQVVGYTGVAFEEVAMDRDKKGVILLKIAREAIAEAFGQKRLDKKAILKAHPWLAKSGAAFVTLNRRENGALRGCIGSLVAHQSLYEDIVKNAQSAAFSDPRFPALTPEEFDKITVEVSILSEPKSLPYTSVDDLRRKIRPGVDGVILKQGHYQATYLPQVWEQLPDFDAFFASLCKKAGLSGACLSQHPEILVYQVEEYHE